MSLQAHTLAICATGALVEVLPDWFHVAMEPHEPLDLAEKLSRPVVAVFIGDESMRVTGRQWASSSTVIELVVQVILPRIVRAELGGAVCEFDTGRGGTRAVYALVHEALRWAFTAPDPDGWGELVQGLFTVHPEPVTGMPGKAERIGSNKPPMPVIDYAIPCAVISPPQLGKPLPAIWTDIVAKMRADEAFAPAEADFLEALLSGRPLTEGRAELALAGLSRIEGAALGLGPLKGVDPAPSLVEAEAEFEPTLTVVRPGPEGAL